LPPTCIRNVRAVHRLHGRHDRLPRLLARRVDRDVAQRVRVLDGEQVDRADGRAGLADRGRHAAEHAGAVGDSDAQDERELGGGGRRHAPPGCYA